MIFYILIGISIILICLIIFVFYKDIKGKHKKKKSPPTKKPLNYFKEPIKKEICLLNKNALREDLTSRSIIISKDINKIEDNCFIHCMNLASIKVDEENKYFCDKLGVLFTKDMKKIIYYPALKQTSTYFIPQGVEEINNHAFFNNNSLKYIIIPTSLNTIGENSFVNCKYLNQVVIPDNVKEIHPMAFNLCPRITIRCYKNSLAEDFCIKYFIPFEYLTS